MIRSILAVIAGIVVLTVVSFAIEAAADPLLMHSFPHALPDAVALAKNVWARLFMIFYTSFAIAAGGYVTAWIAGRAQLAVAAIMGAVEAGLTLYVLVAAPFPEVHMAPRWGTIVGLLLIVPAAWFGGLVRKRQAGPKPELSAREVEFLRRM